MSVICVLFSILSTDTASNVRKNEIDGWISFQPMIDSHLEAGGSEDDRPTSMDSQADLEASINEMETLDNDKPFVQDDREVASDKSARVHQSARSWKKHPMMGSRRNYFRPSLRQQRSQMISNARDKSRYERPFLSKRYSRNLRLTDPLGGNKIHFLVHIHKSAGTSMCNMATRHRLRTLARRNCNVQQDQRCCGGKDTVKAQIRFANTTRYDFVAIEKEMYDSMSPEFYHYIVVLRNSKARYFSHFNHIRRRSSKIGHVDGTVGTFVEWYFQQPDNWNTRILCGPRCLDMNKYQLTREIFQYTLNRLRLFEDILFVEDLENSYRKFATKHDWPKTPMYQENVARDAESRSSLVSEYDWDPLMSALDDALYEFGQRKEAGLEPFDEFSPHIQEQLDNYFSQGPSKNCTTVCCGDICSLY